jgi:glycerol transport system ATP-binding protein
LNELPIVKRGAVLDIPDGRTLRALGALASLADGSYRLAFRAEDIRINPPLADAVCLGGTVSVTEITGSESFVHVDVGTGHWVALLRGVHDLPPGAQVTAGVDPRRVFVFGADDVAVHAPALSEAV